MEHDDAEVEDEVAVGAEGEDDEFARFAEFLEEFVDNASEEEEIVVVDNVVEGIAFENPVVPPPNLPRRRTIIVSNIRLGLTRGYIEYVWWVQKVTFSLDRQSVYVRFSARSG